MPTPRKGYFLRDGTKVPSTTTIIGRWKESGGLLHWAFKQGQSGAASLYEERDKAADAGTLAHLMVEAHIKGQPDDVVAALGDGSPAEIARQARDAYAAFLTWERHTKLTVVEQEMQLVSEEYRYGGTPDAIGLIDGQLCLLDWKTSNSVYQDYLIQLAAYDHLWTENHPDRPLTGGFHLCRFAKERGDFAHHYYPRLDEAWRAFVLMRELYDIDLKLKKRAA